MSEQMAEKVMSHRSGRGGSTHHTDWKSIHSAKSSANLSMANMPSSQAEAPNETSPSSSPDASTTPHPPVREPCALTTTTHSAEHERGSRATDPGAGRGPPAPVLAVLAVAVKQSAAGLALWVVVRVPLGSRGDAVVACVWLTTFSWWSVKLGLALRLLTAEAQTVDE